MPPPAKRPWLFPLLLLFLLGAVALVVAVRLRGGTDDQSAEVNVPPAEIAPADSPGEEALPPLPPTSSPEPGRRTGAKGGEEDGGDGGEGDAHGEATEEGKTRSFTRADWEAEEAAREEKIIGIGGGAGGCFGGRFGGRRNLRAYGGGRHTESAALMALIWLKYHQDPVGTWSCMNFMANCRKGTCTNPGASQDFDAGLTALSLLTYLGAGHTHLHGKFKNTVRLGLTALMDLQTPDGCFGPQSGDGHWIYNHAICTTVFAESHALTGGENPALKGMAQKGVDFLLACQNPFSGWGYGKRPERMDTSCTVWAVTALKTAAMAGLEVPAESFTGALNWFAQKTDPESGRVGYTVPGDVGARSADAAGRFPPTETMTAATLFCRIWLGGDEARGDPAILAGADLLKAMVPKWSVSEGTIDMYYWYWGTQACFQLGRSSWKAWNEPMKNSLVPTQKREGCENGSWDPVGAWGSMGGRVYATALNALTMEIYYRYARVPK
ncbi:MAG: hypothetical protein ACYS47_08840 [Planctomycetota bacterium]